MSISDAQPPDDDRPVAIPRALSARQERRLADALEARFLDLTRNYKKRTTPASTTPTLHAYLTSAQPTLSLILLTPPTSSAHIRTAFLLRHTSDVLAVFPGYEPEKVEVDALIEWCEVVDRGWEAVLKGWRWSAEIGEGVAEDEEQVGGGGSTKGVSQTDRIRLRSLLLTGTTRIEEWLARAPPSQPTTTDTHDENGGAERADDLEMRARLEALFERSLDALGVDDEGRVEMTDLVPAEVLMRFGDGEGAGEWVEDDDVDMDGETSSNGDESDMERVG